MSQHSGDVMARAKDGATPLHWASSTGALECTVKLVELGADILASCDNDRTPLRWAAVNGHVEVLAKVRRLADHLHTRCSTMNAVTVPL